MIKFFIVLISLFPIALLADTISLRADLWCPHNCDPTGEKPGYLIEIAREVFKKAGHTIDYQTLNWPRAIEETRRGNYDGIVGANRNDVPDFIFPQNETGISVNHLFGRKGEKWRFKGVESLKQAKIGVIKDYTYDSVTNDLIAKHHPSFFVASGDTALEQLVKMLKAGRLTAIYEDAAVMQSNSGMGKDELEDLGWISLKSLSIFIAFSPTKPTSKGYAITLSEGVEVLRKTGELSKILKKYGLKDWR